MRLPMAPLRMRENERARVFSFFLVLTKRKTIAPMAIRETITKRIEPIPPLSPPKIPKAPPVFLTWISGESVDIVQDNSNISVPLMVSSKGYGIFWNNRSEEALRMNHGNRTLAAQQLGISLRTLQYRLKEYEARQACEPGNK